MDKFCKNTKDLNYFFRNRLAQFYSIIESKKLDGILLISSYDCGYSLHMHRAIKWLLFGVSSLVKIDEANLPSEFNETFIVVTLTKIFIFSLSSTKVFFYELTSKVKNVEFFHHF